MKIEDILCIDIDLTRMEVEDFEFQVRIREGFVNDFNLNGDKLANEILEVLAKHMNAGLK